MVVVMVIHSAVGPSPVPNHGNGSDGERVMVMVMVIHSAVGPSPVPPIYLYGYFSFGLVRPAWIKYTCSAVPQDVEGLIRPPRSRRDARFAYPPCTLAARPEISGGSRCCIIKPQLAVANGAGGSKYPGAA